MRWYIVQTQPNYENKVLERIQAKIATDNLAASVGRILVPTEKVEEVKNGKKIIAEKKRYPGYIFVEMDLDDRNWLAISKIAHVSGFLGAGGGARPRPMPAHEVARLEEEQQKGQEHARPRVIYELGSTVQIIEGVFSGFHAVVDTVDYEKARARVLVSVFGRETPVELEFSHIENAV